MKNKLKLQLICVLAMVIIGTVLAGCSIGMDSLDEILQKNDLTAQITYFANGGWFNNDVNSVSRDIYYKENSKALELTDSTQTKIRHTEYIYAGWYTIARAQIDGVEHFVCDITDDQALEFFRVGGKVMVVKNGENYVVSVADYQTLASNGKVPALKLDQPFDFANTTLAKGDKLFLAAKWLPNQKVEYVLIAEDCSSITVRNNDGTTSTFQNGEVVASELFDSNGVFTVPTDYNLSPVESDDATFVDYYVYEENATLDNLVRLSDTTESIPRPTDGSNVKVLVKYTAGSWKVLRFAEDVRQIFTSPANKYYVAQDIDCANQKATFPVDGIFRGEIRGNGHKIVGIKTEQARLTSGSSVALFGTLDQSAVIKDITFENVSLAVTTRPGENSFINVYLLAHTLRGESTPTLSNVKFSGVTVDVTLADGVSINNILFDGTNYDTTTWWCKGLTNEQFATTFPTVAIQNYQLIINTQTVAN